jgi:hypothetical protein
LIDSNLAALVSNELRLSDTESVIDWIGKSRQTQKGLEQEL